MKYRVIIATLEARTAVHIGSGRGNDLTDAPIRRDARGKPFIPGTAIAGALRSLATRLAPRLKLENNKICAALTGSRASCDCPVCHLFGDINPSDKEGAESAASRILVFNARLRLKDNDHPRDNFPRPLIRDGVGIDRVTGAAARAGSVKFDLEVLPAGVEFEVRFELRGTSEVDEQLLVALLQEWQEGRVWLGGRVARGLGAFKLKDVEYKSLDLDKADNLLGFLTSDKPWDDVAHSQPDWLQNTLRDIHPLPVDDKAPSAVIRYWITIEGTLQAEGPLLTNDAMVAGQSGFDHAPLLTQVVDWKKPLLAQADDWKKPVLTGAGLRGVLRSHAERIARTLATYAASGLDDFLLKCPACSPVESRVDKPLASCDALLKDAHVSSSTTVSDDHLCLACRLFGSTRRGSRLIVEDALYTGEQPPKLKMLDFLAIDRFTGGGKDGAKFDALALWKPAFQLRLYLENPQVWELGWLALVLRDLEEGWLSVGFGAAKGFGRVRLQNWKAIFGYLMDDDLPSELQSRGSQGESGIFKTRTLHGGTKEWNAIASRWVFREETHQEKPAQKAFYDTVREFKREKLPPLKVDSYFGKVDTIYRVKEGAA